MRRSIISSLMVIFVAFAVFAAFPAFKVNADTGDPITITSQPSDFTGQVGETARFTVAAEGEGLSYQWQLKKGSSWSNLSSGGAKTATLSIKLDESKNGKTYQCVITDGEGNTATSNSAVIHIPEPEKELAITSQPSDYVGDIGDYGKYGLLRFLASYGIKIGVNWFLTENDGSTDGKFTTYLKNPADRVYDPELFDALQNIADHPDKTVKMIKQAGIIPDAEFFGEMLKSSSLKADAREWNRRLWFNNSTLMLGNAELIFADPDNGISYRKTARTKDSEKFILPEDVAEYYNSGRNVVYYCHKGRRKQEAWEQAKAEIRNHIRDAQILAVTFHRGTQRSYIFVLHPD